MLWYLSYGGKRAGCLGQPRASMPGFWPAGGAVRLARLRATSGAFVHCLFLNPVSAGQDPLARNERFVQAFGERAW